ncbi:MAG: replication-relaxation family protein [Candidatus Limnocylindria bacterium]
MNALFRTWPERAPAALDIGLLPMRDRACLRLLDRYEAATAEQLAILVHPTLRTSQRRLRRLWRLGLLERSPLMPEHGGIPMAYRLSRLGRSRMGAVDPRVASAARLRHSLDIIWVTAALIDWSEEREARFGMEPLVQVSLSEGQTVGILGHSLRPDSIIALQSNPFSGVLCVEVDEGTERSAVIRAKLSDYATHLRARRGWHVLFVVPSRQRLEWLRRATGWNHWPELVGRCWGVVLPELRDVGAYATAMPVACRGEPRPLLAVLDDPRPRRCPTPVGSDEWVELLATGGGEDVSEALR